MNYTHYGLDAFWKSLTTNRSHLELRRKTAAYNMFWERRNQSPVWHQIVVNEYHAQHFNYIKKNKG